MFQHVVLKEVFEHPCIVLVSPYKELSQFTQSLDQRGLVESVYDLIGRVQQDVVYALKLFERVRGHLVIGGPPKDSGPEAFVRHLDELGDLQMGVDSAVSSSAGCIEGTELSRMTCGHAFQLIISPAQYDIQ